MTPKLCSVCLQPSHPGRFCALMLPSDLARRTADLRTLLDAATPGPWWVERGGDGHVNPREFFYAVNPGYRSDVGYEQPINCQNDQATADLIAAAVNALPALLDAAEDNDRLTAAIHRQDRHFTATCDSLVRTEAQVAALTAERDGLKAANDEAKSIMQGLVDTAPDLTAERDRLRADVQYARAQIAGYLSCPTGCDACTAALRTALEGGPG